MPQKAPLSFYGEFMNSQKSNIAIYKTEDGKIELNVQLENDTVWLTANQMALLFSRDEKTIRKHINNVFAENELDKENNTQNLRVDNIKQAVAFYTLDVIISVGYRVKSQQGVQFRRWATSVLKDYLVKGFAVNQNRLNHYNDLKDVVALMSRTIAHIKTNFQRTNIRDCSLKQNTQNSQMN